MKRAVATGLLAAVVGGFLMAAEPAGMTAPEPLPLTATPVPLDPSDPARTDVGALHYLGGLVLRSSNPAFGGVSALRAGPGGRLLGITDTGAWVSFGMVLRGQRLVGVRSGWMAPLRDEHGEVAHAKADADAEGLDWHPGTGEAVVSLEQDHRLMLFRGIDAADPATLDRPAVATVRNPGTARWPANGGGEAEVDLADGSRLIFEEEGQDAAGASDVLQVRGGVTQLLRYTPPAGYRPTDAVELRPGVLLVLNRRFTPLEGVSAALVLVRVGPAMHGREIARLAAPLSVDNMEGMALEQSGGQTVITLVSDDNFNALQRTLLLRFAVRIDAR